MDRKGCSRFSKDDAGRLHELLTWRRDIRHFRTDPVPDELVAELRHAMDLAPSVGNARPWLVLQVDDANVRQAVRQEFERCNRDAANLYEGEQHRDYLRLKLEGLETAPVQLAVFTAIDPARGHGLGRQTIAETLVQSTAMAVHTLWLAARVRNLGLGMVSILDADAMDRLFALGPDYRFTAYLCIGWPVFDDDTPLLHRAGWQQNFPARWERR